MTEKNTDYYMLNEYNNIFNYEYHTEGNKELFGNKKPDCLTKSNKEGKRKLFPSGYDIYEENKILIIIENKKSIKLLKNAKNQIKEYYDNLPDNIKNNYKIYLIIGFGNSNKSFNYNIYDKDFNILNIKLIDIYNKIQNNNKIYDEKQIHKINEYMHNNLNLQKTQKLLFISSILLCLEIDSDLLLDYNEKTNNYIISEKIIKTLKKYYNDNIFSNSFIFLLKSLSNKHLYTIFNMIKNDIKIYGKDILNLFYTEFCIWDVDDEAKLGVVLTPHHIVKLMVKELNLNENDKVLDFCTGTGSFLIECGKYTKYLYGCENNDMRYTLAKINFILHKLNYDNLIYSSCFDYNYKTEEFDKIIFNPPFNQNIKDENNLNNTCNWKKYNYDAKFILYGIELLKINGIGCCIVPRSNFNNNEKEINEFKKEFLKHCEIIKIIDCIKNPFYPIGTNPAIIVFKKIKENNNDNIILNNVEIINYDDGYKIFKNNRIKDNKIKESFNKQYRDLKYNDDWNYINDIQIINIIELLKKNIVETYINKMKTKININDLDIIYNEMINKLKDINNMNIISYKKITIKDIAEKQKLIKKVFKINEMDNGDYPLISSSMFNNGITKYINDYNYDCQNNNIISIARNGSVGYCFVQTGKIGITTDIILLKIIDETIDKYILSILLTYYLTSRYNYGNKLTIDKLLNTIIDYPIFE